MPLSPGLTIPKGFGLLVGSPHSDLPSFRPLGLIRGGQEDPFMGIYCGNLRNSNAFFSQGIWGKTKKG